jgi:hypothetical protein
MKKNFRRSEIVSQAIRIASQSGISTGEEVMGFQALIAGPLGLYETSELSRVVSFPEPSPYFAARPVNGDEEEDEEDWDDEDEEDEDDDDWDDDEDEDDEDEDDDEDDEEDDDWDEDYDEDEDEEDEDDEDDEGEDK